MTCRRGDLATERFQSFGLIHGQLAYEVEGRQSYEKPYRDDRGLAVWLWRIMVAGIEVVRASHSSPLTPLARSAILRSLNVKRQLFSFGATILNSEVGLTSLNSKIYR
jgi:hypothetical protein